MGRNHHPNIAIPIKDYKYKNIVASPFTDDESEFYLNGNSESKFVGFHAKHARRSPLFKKAKYISIYKWIESKNRYIISGTPRITRRYMIAILTDDNKFYFNEIQIKQSLLTNNNIILFNQIFLNGYIINSDTKIVMTKTSRKRSDPVYLFLKIVARVVGIKIIFRDNVDMTRHVNNWLKLVRVGKKTEFGAQHRRYLMKRLMEYEYFDFIPEDFREELMKTGYIKKERRRAMCYTCIGLLYLHYSKLRAPYHPAGRGRGYKVDDVIYMTNENMKYGQNHNLSSTISTLIQQ